MHGGSCVTDVIKLAVPLRVSINFDVETEVKLVWETKQAAKRRFWWPERYCGCEIGQFH